MSQWGDMPSNLESGRDPHVDSFQEWMDEDIEPVDELDSSGVTEEYQNQESPDDEK